MNIEQYITSTDSKNLWRKFIKAIERYELISDGDRIAVCISGGKDSMLLAKLLQMVEKYKLYDIKTEYIMMDAGYASKDISIIKDNADKLEIPLQIFETTVFDDVDSIQGSPCFFCSRMRRGFLYRKAREIGCNKIALGHHYNDVVETILMGMLYGAQIQTMLPKLASDNVEGLELIRPLYLIHEEDIIKWRDECGFTFTKCACRVKKSGEDEDTTRLKVRKLIRDLMNDNAHIEDNIWGSVMNVNLDKIVGYTDNGVHYTFMDRQDRN